VGFLIFDTGEAVKTTRAASAGMALVPLRGKETFVSNGARTWNGSETLQGGNVKVGSKASSQKPRCKIAALARYPQRQRTRPTRQRRQPT
jgi:hypothetical protein